MTQDKNLDREGGENIDAILREICDMQAANYGNGVATHMALIDLTERARAALAAEPQAGAAVPKDTPESMAASNARFAIDGAIQFGRENRNPPPSTEHWLYEYWNIGRQLAKLGETGWDNVTPLADTGASGAGEVLPKWIDDLKGRDPTIDELIHHIIDLRAQLARLQAPVGETIDTREFRKLELAYAKGFYAWEDAPSEETGKALGDARKALIAHIDAQLQLARQRKGCETIYQAQYSDRTPGAWIDVSKRQYDLYNERGLGKIPVRILHTTPPSAQQEQGDAVRDAKRWRFSMEFQELARTGASQPEPIKAMWRKVYAERRLHPTREEYEAATDAAIALRATNTGKEQP